MKLDIKLPMIYHTSLNKDDNFPHCIIASGEHSGVRFYICNINGMHPTAYLRIPKGKPLHGAEALTRQGLYEIIINRNIKRFKARNERRIT